MSERLDELLVRLVGPGPKCSHVSASECHEIVDEVATLRSRLMEAEKERDEWKTWADGMMKMSHASYVAGAEKADARATLAEAVVAFLRQFAVDTAAVPVGEEDPVRGASVYNWRAMFVRQFMPLVEAYDRAKEGA